MGFSLTMVNLWIGLCRGAAGLPRALQALGYEDRLIEWQFRTDSGEQVCPDLVVASKACGHCLLLEFKGGENADEGQLHRYAGVTQETLQSLAFLQPEETSTHDTVVVGAAEHRRRLVLALTKAKEQFPLLVSYAHSLKLAAHSIREARTNALFQDRGLRVDLSTAPMGFVPFDGESEDWEIAEVVGPILLEYMNMRRSRILVDEICEEVFTLVWAAMGTPARDTARSRVRSVLLMLADECFAEYVRCEGGRKFEGVIVVQNPLEFLSDRRTAAFQKLRRSLGDFVESVRTGVRRLEGVQMSLAFDEMATPDPK